MHFNKYQFKTLSNLREANLRKGQSIFNEVCKLFPKEANTLVGTVYDCFYDDNKIDLFLEKMKQLTEFVSPKETRPESTYLKTFYRLGENIKTRELRRDRKCY